MRHIALYMYTHIINEEGQNITNWIYMNIVQGQHTPKRITHTYMTHAPVASQSAGIGG